MIHKFECEVIQTSVVQVEIDDESMDEKFMAEFRASFYPFTTLKEHAEHIAQMAARDLFGWDGFAEGYGHINGSKVEPFININARVTSEDVEVETLTTAS